MASFQRIFLTTTLAGLLASMAALSVAAQEFPARAVKIVVPFPAGGTADAVPRLIGDWLSRKWGQAVIIENKAGAAGNIGAEMVANSDPDGYTLLSAPPPPLVINQSLYPKLGYDASQFVPIVIMAAVPNALSVNPQKVPQNTLADFIANAKANPGKVTSATQGNGTTSHLTSEMFQMMSGVKFQHIPYRGSAPALQDLVAGNVDVMFDNLASSLPLIQGGKLKLIAVAAPKRLAALPNVPAIAETLPGFEATAWFGIVAPPKTPKAIVEKINADVNEALKQPEIIAKLKAMAAETVGGTTVATAKYMHEEVERWRKVIKAAHVTIN